MIKVIQIAPVQAEAIDGTPGIRLHALTSDGQIWAYVKGYGWSKLDGPVPPVPEADMSEQKKAIGRILEALHHATDWRNE